MTNKEIVLRALHELLVEKDVTAVERYWGEAYIQHSPYTDNGREHVARAVEGLGPGFVYEPGMAVEEGDLVMVHGRLRGAAAVPLIVVDILRLEEGKIVEHWDVMQEEVRETVSGNPMFAPRR